MKSEMRKRGKLNLKWKVKSSRKYFLSHSLFYALARVRYMNFRTQ